MNFEDLFPGINKKEKDKNYNREQEFICSNCGGHAKGIATWHIGKCADCGQSSYLTQRRDFIK